jgi:hypothetical protein
LTVRDPDDWYESMLSTVYEVMAAPDRAAGGDASARAALELARELVLDGFFGGRFADRQAALALFRQHNQAVQAALAPERLLVYEVREGWGPLCEFLGTEVPRAPFPNTNARAAFRERAGLEPSRRA